MHRKEKKKRRGKGKRKEEKIGDLIDTHTHIHIQSTTSSSGLINQRFSWISLIVYLLTFWLTSVNVLINVSERRFHLNNVTIYVKNH